MKKIILICPENLKKLKNNLFCIKNWKIEKLYILYRTRDIRLLSNFLYYDLFFFFMFGNFDKKNYCIFI